MNGNYTIILLLSISVDILHNDPISGWLWSYNPEMSEHRERYTFTFFFRMESGRRSSWINSTQNLIHGIFEIQTLVYSPSFNSLTFPSLECVNSQAAEAVSLPICQCQAPRPHLGGEIEPVLMAWNKLQPWRIPWLITGSLLHVGKIMKTHSF